MGKLIVVFVGLFVSFVATPAQTADCKSVYLDYFSAMADDQGFLKDELSNDGLHPNQQGYAVMAPLAEAAIATSLKSRR